MYPRSMEADTLQLNEEQSGSGYTLCLTSCRYFWQLANKLEYLVIVRFTESMNRTDVRETIRHVHTPPGLGIEILDAA